MNSLGHSKKKKTLILVNGNFKKKKSPGRLLNNDILKYVYHLCENSNDFIQAAQLGLPDDSGLGLSIHSKRERVH